MRAPRVFLSYSHDGSEHRATALALAELLRQFGVDAHIDRYYEIPPPTSWPTWMHDQVEAADRVLVICSEAYNRRLLGREAADHGKGARWEGAILTQLSYESDIGKFIPVVFAANDCPHIPYFLRSTTHYVIDVASMDGIEPLLRHLFNEPEIVPMAVGNRPIFPLGPHGVSSTREQTAVPVPQDSALVADQFSEASESLLRAAEMAAIGEPLERALLAVRTSLNAFAAGMSERVGSECRATVYTLDADHPPSIGSTPKESIYVQPIATSSDSTSVPSRPSGRSPLAEHLDLSTALGEQKAVIDIDTSIGSNILSRHYVAPHHSSSMTWPILVKYEGLYLKSRALGLLCLDSMTPDAFEANRDLAIGSLYASLLFMVLRFLADGPARL